VVVLEGAARAGIAEADLDRVRVVHAAQHGDDALVAQTAAAATGVIFVTADRCLFEPVRELGAETVGPSWLNDRLRSDGRSTAEAVITGRPAAGPRILGVRPTDLSDFDTPDPERRLGRPGFRSKDERAGCCRNSTEQRDRQPRPSSRLG
jgi:hypothetical protein